ncbi:MAG: hypothetical protein ACOZF2_15145 [Thermodesulfobacteriota bacterium]
MTRFPTLLALLAALLLCAAPVPAADGLLVVGGHPAMGTRITSLPYTISVPGHYFISRNLSYTGGHGITVNSSNVTLDLMGFTVTGPNVSSSYVGVIIHNQNNVEVRNGTLTGWYMGVQEDGGGDNHQIIGIRAAGNRIGIYLTGTRHLIKGCTAFPGSYGSTIGLLISGTGAISGCTVRSFDIGISIYEGTVSSNVVSDCAIGINANGNTMINYNQVSSCSSGINGTGGGSIVGNTVFIGSDQTGIVPAPVGGTPNLVDQNNASGPGTRYGPGCGNTVWGANGGR